MQHCPKCRCNEQQTTTTEEGRKGLILKTYCVHCGYVWPVVYQRIQEGGIDEKFICDEKEL